jgi:ATP-binding cassette, subfamily B, bacterial
MSTADRQAPADARRLIRHGRGALRIAWTASWPIAACQALLTILVGTTPVAAAWLLKLILDEVSDNGSSGRLAALAGSVAILGALIAVVPRVVSYLQNELDRRVKLASLDIIFSTLNERLRGLARLEDPAFHNRLRLAGSAGEPPRGVRRLHSLEG